MSAALLEDVIETFDLMDDWDDRYRFLIDLGRSLPPLEDDERTEANKVRGCASQVWLVPEWREGKLYLRGDSDAHIVKGLVALLISLYSGMAAEEILETDARAFFDRLGLSGHLSPMRANGLFSMIGRIREMAKEAGTGIPA